MIKYNFEQSMGKLAMEVSHGLGKLLQRRFDAKGFQVSSDQWIVLVYLWARNGQTQNELAEATGKDKATLKRLIDLLEKRGLLSRLPDARDRRANRIVLTNKGRACQDELIPEAEHTLTQAYAGISEEEVAACLETLQRIQHNLNQALTPSPGESTSRQTK